MGESKSVRNRCCWKRNPCQFASIARIASPLAWWQTSSLAELFAARNVARLLLPIGWFSWNDWNEEHIAHHGVVLQEAEKVVRGSKPRHRGDGNYRAVGRGQGGRWLQVIYVLDEDGTAYVIHARPLTDTEKRRERRGKR